MKNLKYILSIVLLTVSFYIQAQQLKEEAFSLLNLDYQGMQEVKAAYAAQNYVEAAKEEFI